MSADHKRPLLAFVLVMIACLLIVVNAARSQALRSVLYDGAQRVAAGVALALDEDPVPVAATAPRSFDRDEHAVAARRLPAATILLPAPRVVGSQHVARAPRPPAASRHGHATSRTHRAARAGHQRATAGTHGARKASGHGPTRATPHRPPAHAASGHRISSRPHKAHSRAHAPSQHRYHHRGGRHHRR